MILFNKNIVLLLVMFIALWEAQYALSAKNKMGGSFFFIPTTKTHVIVYNYLEGLNFTIHCKSGDDDLGTHVIAPQDNYNWKFRVNIVQSTLFFCGINWRDGQVVSDLYKANRDEDRCPEYCYWHVKKDGVFGYNDLGKLDLVFRWSKPTN